MARSEKVYLERHFNSASGRKKNMLFLMPALWPHMLGN